MDKAYWDGMRWGHFRWNVYNPEFDRVLDAKKKQTPKTIAGVSPAAAGHIVAGHWRAGVTRAEFDAVLERMKK